MLSRTRRPHVRVELEAELACPPFPRALDYLWRAYGRIRRRKGGGFGLAPIEWPDIDAFMRVAQFQLSAWEVEVVETLDDLFVKIHSSSKHAPDSHRADD